MKNTVGDVKNSKAGVRGIDLSNSILLLNIVMMSYWKENSLDRIEKIIIHVGKILLRNIVSPPAKS